MNSIDAVISWVNGYDLNYQKKLSDFCLTLGVEPNTVVEPTRIQQCNEIHYCLHSLFRFAPWLRTIYLITNEQIPQAVLDLQGSPLANKICVIDQNELLREQQISTPVFNSIAIEWLIWHIKGLSEQFIYLNDDFFLLRELTANDFFRDNQLVLRGQWKKQSEQKLFYRLKKCAYKIFTRQEIKTSIDLHRHLQEKGAQLARFDTYFFLLSHAPFSLKKTAFLEYLALNPQAMADNLRYPFRHKEQVSSIPLITHQLMNAHEVVYDTHKRTIMVNGAYHSFKKIKNRLQQVQTNRNITFLCVQSLDQAPQETKQYIDKWLTTHIL
ncbi:MAG: hypothetical protein QM652_08620 [Legionella sp.]|uniref:hypothetical protein n=1 Tax=Legionella sp. TaxID=459 RepID=UPI0039E5F92B